MIYLYRYTFDNGKAYIGITSDVKARHASHMASRGAVVDRALRKHRFTLEVLAVCPSYEYAYELEQRAIVGFNTLLPNGYNISPGGWCGIGHSPETRKRIGEAQKGNKHALGLSPSEETRRKISEAGRGKTRSPETRARMSQAQRGNKHNLGKTLSEETKFKISQANKGKKRSAESRALMSEKAKGNTSRRKRALANPPPTEV